MTWLDLTADVIEVFCDAQSHHAERLRAIGWHRHSDYVERKRDAKRRHSLRALRTRMFRRGLITCKRKGCEVQFCPYRGNTRYCSDACRIRHLSLQAYYRRKKARKQTARTCSVCGRCVKGRRVDAIYCSVKCNRRAVRARKKATCSSTPMQGT